MEEDKEMEEEKEDCRRFIHLCFDLCPLSRIDPKSGYPIARRFGFNSPLSSPQAPQPPKPNKATHTSGGVAVLESGLHAHSCIDLS